MAIEQRFLAAFAPRPRPRAGEIIEPARTPEYDRMSAVLEARAVAEISADDIIQVIEGNLFALTPSAVRYYLPALMDRCLTSYPALRDFAQELVDALTRPEREDILRTLDKLAGWQATGPELLDPPTMAALRARQLEWFDSGEPLECFHQRFDPLSDAEGQAVLVFLRAVRDEHGADFPSGAPGTAIDRHWSRYADRRSP